MKRSYESIFSEAILGERVGERCAHKTAEPIEGGRICPIPKTHRFIESAPYSM
jgi:hypothetical protein